MKEKGKSSRLLLRMTLCSSLYILAVRSWLRKQEPIDQYSYMTSFYFSHSVLHKNVFINSHPTRQTLNCSSSTNTSLVLKVIRDSIRMMMQEDGLRWWGLVPEALGKTRDSALLITVFGKTIIIRKVLRNCSYHYHSSSLNMF